MNIPILVIPWIFFGKWVGFALPFCIVLKTYNEKMVRHEMCHVKQWWRYWIVGFIFLYLYYTAIYGYYKNPLEMEARHCEYV